jgi:hypothetical protein
MAGSLQAAELYVSPGDSGMKLDLRWTPYRDAALRDVSGMPAPAFASDSCIAATNYYKPRGRKIKSNVPSPESC